MTSRQGWKPGVWLLASRSMTNENSECLENLYWFTMHFQTVISFYAYKNCLKGNKDPWVTEDVRSLEEWVYPGVCDEAKPWSSVLCAWIRGFPMQYTVLSLGVVLRHCGCSPMLFTTLLVSSLSLFPSQNVAINSKRERKEGNDKQKRKSHSEEIAVCKVFMNDLFPFHLWDNTLTCPGPSFLW